jgi:hypothetical protein
LDRYDGRAEGLPYELAKIAIDLQVWLGVRRCHHVTGDIKGKLPVNEDLEGFGRCSRRGALDVDRCGPGTGIIPEVAVEWAT